MVVYEPSCFLRSRYVITWFQKSRRVPSFTTTWRKSCFHFHVTEMPWVLSLSCHEVATEVRYLCNVANMSSHDCESCATFCHMSEILSGGCGGHVVVVIWSKTCQIIEKKLCFSGHPGVMFRWCYKKILLRPHGRNVRLVLQKNVIWATLQKHALMLQRKCYLDRIAATLSSCYKIMFLWPHCRNVS